MQMDCKYSTHMSRTRAGWRNE